MAKLVEVSGSLVVNGDACTAATSGQTTKPLSLGPFGCGGQQFYESSVGVDKLALSSTVDDIECLDSLTAIELLYVKTSAKATLRINAIAAVAVGSGGSYPTGFSGGETLATTIDGVIVTTVFDVADQSLAEVIARVNAAFALAGYATPRADESSGQLRITGVKTAVDGDEGTLSFSGTGAAQLGYTTPVVTDAQGADIEVNGLYIHEFPRSPDAPTKIQAFGDATIDLVAAGRST